MNNQNETAVNGNWIKLSRELLEWGWFKDANTLQVWIYLLLKANHKDGEWMGNKIKRGQLITSLDTMVKDTGLSKQKIRTCLEHLKKTQEINTQTNTHFTLITICKYDSYQGGLIEVNTQVTHSQHTVNTKQEVKNDNKDKEDLKLASQVSSAEKPGRNILSSEKESNSSEPKQPFIPSEPKQPFSRKNLYEMVKLNFNGKIDSNKYHFINGCYDKVESQGFVYQTSGNAVTLDSLTDFIVKSFTKDEVQAPFTKEELLSVISSEPQIVQDELMKKYDIFQKKGWKTSKGEEVTISFFTGFLRNEVRKSFNIQEGRSLKYNEYDPKKIDVKNFWN